MVGSLGLVVAGLVGAMGLVGAIGPEGAIGLVGMVCEGVLFGSSRM